MSLVGLLLVARTAGAETAPVIASPGHSTEMLRVADHCPTFSWGQVENAREYELVVYRLSREGETTQVLRQKLSGSISAWTPSLEDCLDRGGKYAWSLRAKSAESASPWSLPSLFEVAAGPSVREFEEALSIVQQYVSEQKMSASSDLSTTMSATTSADKMVDEPVSETVAMVPEIPESVSLTTEGAVGVGISAPLADLHVVGGPTTAGLMVSSNYVGNGGTADLLLAENETGTFGMRFSYDGFTDTLNLFGEHEFQGQRGPWLQIERDSGAASFGGVLSGNGSGLTAVDAETIDGLDSTAFGDITQVTAGSGLSGGGPTGAVALAVGTGAITSTHVENGTISNQDIDVNTVQQRVTGSCSGTRSIGSISSTGEVVCSDDPSSGFEETVAASNNSTVTIEILGNVCFLTGVQVRDVDSPTEIAACKLTYLEFGIWELKAQTTDDADAWCWARCFNHFLPPPDGVGLP